MSGMIPEYILYLAVGILGFIILILVMREFNMRKNAEVGYIMAKAKLENKPVLELLEIATMNLKYILGEYDEKGKPFWDLDLNAHYMKPDFSSGKCRPSFHNGVAIFNYATIKTNPMDRETMLALNTLSDHREDEDISEVNEVIKHICDRDLFSLFRSPLKFLKKDCELFLPDDILNSSEELKELRLVEIYDAVREVKKHLDKQKVELGWYSKVLAFETNPFAKSAQDTERIIAEVRAEERDKWLDNDRRMNLMIFAGGVFGFLLLAAGISVYILSIAAK